MKIPITHTIETPRCILRAPSAADIPHVFSATRHLGFNDWMAWGPPENEEALYEPLARNLKLWSEGASFTFSVDEKVTRTFVGRVVIRLTDQPNVWALGYWTHPNHQRQGFMTEAASAVLNFGFTDLAAYRIEACHVVSNIPSRRVLEKIGMIEVEYLAQGLKKNEVWLPEYKFAISRQK